MTGKNSGKHGVFEFLEYEHNPLGGRVNSSAIHPAPTCVWEIAARHGKTAVAAAVPMSYPPRKVPGVTSWATSSPPPTPPTSPATPHLLRDLEAALGEPYRPWDTSVHDGGREAAGPHSPSPPSSTTTSRPSEFLAQDRAPGTSSSTT